MNTKKNNSNFNWNGKDGSGNFLPTNSYWAILKWNNSRTGNPVTKQMWLLLKNR